MTLYARPQRVAFDIVLKGSLQIPVVFLMPLPDGPALCLRGVAARIWIEAVQGEDDVAARVAARMGEERARIEPEILDFLDALVSDGLLTIAGEHR